MRPTVAVRRSGSPESRSFDDTVDPVDRQIFRRIGERPYANGWPPGVGSFRVGRRGDLDGGGSVNAGDLDRNGITESEEFVLLFGNWGECVGGAAWP